MTSIVTKRSLGRAETRTCTGLPVGENLSALSIRFKSAASRSAGRAKITGTLAA